MGLRDCVGPGEGETARTAQEAKCEEELMAMSVDEPMEGPKLPRPSQASGAGDFDSGQEQEARHKKMLEGLKREHEVELAKAREARQDKGTGLLWYRILCAV